MEKRTVIIRNIVVEVTRRCNMACSHCLRGDAENVNFDVEYLETLMKQNVLIGGLTLSGGEPSLATDVIKKIREVVLKYQPSIDNFYIATNGKDIPEEFVIECLKWYSISDDKEVCRVELSNDYWHSVGYGGDPGILAGLSFFGNKYENSEFDPKYTLIKEGNARDLDGVKFKEETPSIDIETYEDKIVIDSLYLNCYGSLIKGYDLSYKSQRRKANYFCYVADIRSAIENYLKENDNV